MWAVEGSSALSNCTCNAGFVTIAGVCKVCPSGSFSTDGAAQTCTQCEAGFYSTEGSDDANDCKQFSFAVQARMLLPGVETTQNFLAKRTLFITSLETSVNQADLVSSNYLTITKVCDDTECVEIIKNSRSTLSGKKQQQGR